MQLYTQYIDILYCAVFISEDFVVKDIRKDALVFLSKIVRKEIADIHDRSVVFTGEPSSALKEPTARRCMVRDAEVWNGGIARRGRKKGAVM